MEEEGFAAC